MFEDLKIGKYAWLQDPGNNTWWAHSGGIHPAMPGDKTPILKIGGAQSWKTILGNQHKDSDVGLQCPMCSTLKNAL
ncbi:hypothetical protein GUITHDRAFT_119183 [Guillardia theta CCMP2712]|uniref:Uncharacterized protein n=1 Tax=Guillardia theta (strain CCMP2712) TaxID=905079 RepID=L1IEH7_GUITC|nr:hypothetical protein GUITHDRAFT_119183 [Guillardia theta CCMP2712]EKX34638.1 hypothetical protein GUITHDRAFT_119183 [Guillardia theta CCMP2712]|eukprot:XP_005821618.1 hypothetical protein GUITHDRAFT_119183 [Guillardia theta CCMP2712]